MAQGDFLAGTVIDDVVLNDSTPTTTTSGLVAAANFTVNSFDGRKANGVCTIHCYLLRINSAITATNGNIADTNMCTVPAGYRPKTMLNGVWSDGTSSGEATIDSSGVVQLRTASSDIIITTQRNLRFTITFVDPQ